MLVRGGRSETQQNPRCVQASSNHIASDSFSSTSPYVVGEEEERPEKITIIVAMGGGANPSTHNYPTQVWTPTGGWWCHPKYWRRNTAIAFAGIFAVCIPIAMKSAELEQRPLMPVRPVPSQLWCKNFGDKGAATE